MTKGKPRTKATRNKIAASVARRWQDPEYRARHAAGMVHVNNDPDECQRRSERMKAVWQRPGYKERNYHDMKHINSDKSQLEARSERMKAAWASGKYDVRKMALNFKGRISSAEDSVQQGKE